MEKKDIKRQKRVESVEFKTLMGQMCQEFDKNGLSEACKGFFRDLLVLDKEIQKNGSKK